ncbi:MAG: glycosyltransferase family 4 protein [Ignavibacteriaceae bacterium]|nr:glycosyltransferase family 4 protein [Ignavibacteriaceae bacterium]
MLWFSNTPALGTEFLTPEALTGGWLNALNKELQEYVELHMIFYYARYAEKFYYKKTHYYPICKRNWKLQVFKNIIFNTFIDTQDKHIYLSLIKEIQPDIIHIHGTENPFACIIGEVDIPIVISMQGNISVILKKYSSGIEKKFFSINNYNIKNLRSFIFSRPFNVNLKQYKKMQKREERNMLKCSNIIGRTDWDKRISSILSPDRRYFHNDEILRDIFYTEKWIYPPNTGKLILHTTSRNSPYKGFETICESLYELHKANIQNIEWRVAGISESDLIVKVVKKKLKNRYPQNGLVLLGNINETQLIEKLKEAHIYIMTSHIENSPNGLCEAMMLGMPCIATNVGGTPSLLKDGEEGILIQDGDPWSLAGTILELYNNPDKAAEYGKKAREKALIRHDKNKIVNELLDIYKSISSVN